MDENSWEEAHFDEIEIQNSKNSKVKILKKILEIGGQMKKKLEDDFFTEKLKGESDFNFVQRILKLESVEDQFISLVKGQIGVQLIFFINEKKILKQKLQYVLLNQVENNIVRKSKGLVIAVDGYMTWRNLTAYYSSSPRYLKFIDKIMQCINLYKKKYEIYASMNFLSQNISKVEERIPTAKNMFKHHPLYILPSLLPENYIIFPKNPYVGFFKGEPIFLKNNVKKLHTKKSSRKIGLQPKNEDEFFTEKNDEKFYLEIQAEKLKLHGLEKHMDFFHPNELPVDCAYFDDKFAVEIALFLKIEFSQPTVGFSHKKPVKKGIFIKKLDEKIFMRALSEFKIHKKIDEIIYAGRKFFTALRKIKKRAHYFFELKKSLH